MAKTFSGSDDLINSRDTIGAVVELEDEISDMESDIESVKSEIDDKTVELEDFENECVELDDKEDADEIATLEEQQGACEDEIKNLTQTLSLHEEDLDDLQQALNPLRAVVEEAEGYAPDWQHGATLINDDYFVEYAQQVAEEVSGVSDEWPGSFIYWEAAADALKMDYTSVDFEGNTFWIRM